MIIFIVAGKAFYEIEHPFLIKTQQTQNKLPQPHEGHSAWYQDSLLVQKDKKKKKGYTD